MRRFSPSNTSDDKNYLNENLSYINENPDPFLNMKTFLTKEDQTILDNTSPSSISCDSKSNSRDGTAYLDSIVHEEIMDVSTFSVSPSETPKDSLAFQTHKYNIQDFEKPFLTSSIDSSKKLDIYKLDENSDQYGLINYHCDICNKDITFSCRIKCAECEDFDLCVDCFCKGAEIELDDGRKHLNCHRYIPIGNSSFPLFKADWSADEEIMLLEGISKYGLGNWKEVADLVNRVAIKPKRSFMCERHYYDIYLNSKTSPLPDSRKLLVSSDGGPILLCEDAESTDDERIEFPQCKSNATTRNSTNKPSHQVVGYWPLRGDFDVEYDNDAELILADMEFRDNETAQERDLKLQIIEIYNSKLDERIHRKQTVIERGLLDNKALQQKEKKRTREERELHNLLRPLARFQSDQEQERFVQLLIEEKLLTNRLLKLREWRALGLKTIVEVREYEEEKKRRDDMKSRGTFHPAMLDSGQKYQKRSRIGNRSDDNEIKSKPIHTTPQPQFSSSFNQVGWNILDPQERLLCENINLQPLFYLFTKRILFHEANKMSSLDKESLNKILKLDISQSGGLYDFFLNVDFTLTSRLQQNSDFKTHQTPPPNSKLNITEYNNDSSEAIFNKGNTGE